MNTIFRSHQLRTLLPALLMTLSASAHSYERGAFAPKDPPLMPTIVVYSGQEDTSTPAPASATDTATPSPAPAPDTTAPTPAVAPAPSAPTPVAAPPAPSTPPVRPVVPVPLTITANRASTAAIAEIATPASRDTARRHFIQLVLLLAVLLIVGALIWWFRRPYTPPHTRRKSGDARDFDLDLDLDP